MSSTTGTWYPPSAGTSGFPLTNPLFAPMPTLSPLILNLTTCARLRGQQAAGDGDRARYWRELAGAMRLLGWSDSADDYDRLGQVPRG